MPRLSGGRARWGEEGDRGTEHGNPDDFEYGLALAEIDRIEGLKAVSTRP